MTLYLLNQFKSSDYGVLDATHFSLVLSNKNGNIVDQGLIIEAFNDWKILTPTWFQLVSAIDNIKLLSKNSKFNKSKLASLLVSKLSFFLQDYDTALRYALDAKEEFCVGVEAKDTLFDKVYKEKMVERAIDVYKILRKIDNENESFNSISINDLEGWINQIFEHALFLKDYFLVVGLAIETSRDDYLINAVESAQKNQKIHILVKALFFLLNSSLINAGRERMLISVTELILQLPENDKIFIVKSLIRLNKPEKISETLIALAELQEAIILFQVCFQLYEFSSQHFLMKVADDLNAFKKTEKAKPIIQFINSAESILRGNETSRLHHQFFVLRNQTDSTIIAKIRDTVRNACTHNAALISNGLMHMGTTSDAFLRDNLTWISTATNWNKFNAVASLGLIHRGNEENAKKVLEPYLPKESEQDAFKFKEGGALYAYGLIYANHFNQGEAVNFLAEHLTNATTPALRHGACLGLGLAACGIQDKINVYLKLRDALYRDEAVTGEAAGIAMGLVMAGSLDEEVFNEMRQFIQDTRHDKIQRGLLVGIAMLAYEKFESADKWINGLLNEKSNAILRQAGIWMLAMAYVGADRPSVIKLLLEKIAIDPNQDVKRFAAMALGFVLANDSDHALRYISVLIEHFNGHVRYGAAIAIGLAFIGTGNKDAILLLEPLLSAKENYVRQGALIALSFIMIQKTNGNCSQVQEFRDTLIKTFTAKTQGILDAGGRNVTLSLINRDGGVKMHSVLGMLVFLQHWYWHSTVHFISLSFVPSAIIGINESLQMPKFDFICYNKPSIYAYPPAFEEKKEEFDKVETAVLSITAKQKNLNAKRKENKMLIENDSSNLKNRKECCDEPMDTSEKEKIDTEKQTEVESSNFLLPNPARVVDGQNRFIQFFDTNRFQTIIPLQTGGIILVKNLSDEPIEMVEVEEWSSSPTETVKTDKNDKTIDGEALKPSPFEFDFGLY